MGVFIEGLFHFTRYLLSPGEIVVGYNPTEYTTSEGIGRVDLSIVVFSHPIGGTPREFTLSVRTRDGTAGNIYHNIQCSYMCMSCVILYVQHHQMTIML